MGKKRKFHQITNHLPKGNNYKPTKQVKTPPVKREPSPIPFEAEDAILLIGEGDFSFAKSLVEHHACINVTASCLDSQDELYKKYTPQAQEHVNFLQAEDQKVLFGIDATKLHTYKALRTAEKFDRIIFNFPHVGGRTKDVNRQVRLNQELLVNFFASALNLLSRHGTIIVTLFEGEPYTLWNVKDLARHSSLEVERSFRFNAEAYPDYRHARTLGNIEGGGGWKGEDRGARSFVFRRKGESEGGDKIAGRVKKRKNGSDGESSSGEDR